MQKKGTGPLFVTAYQNFWNANPTIQKDKGLTISTRFKDETVITPKDDKLIKIEVTIFYYL